VSAARYPHVFEPVSLGPVEIKNRFYFSPHGNPYSAGGGPSDAFAYYYAERAAGGCGLLIQALATMPRRDGLGITPYLDEALPSFKATADLVHDDGAKIFGQIHYSRVGNGWRYEPGSTLAPLFGPSNVQIYDDFMVTAEMTLQMIETIVEAHRRSARNLAKAGYDGIEVHCSHAMLLEAFLSPYFNRRTDEYGGSLENRMRLLVECLEAARDGAGPNLAVGMRFNVDEMIPGGLTIADSREILARLAESRLLDFVDLDIALEPNQFEYGMPSYLFPKQVYRPYVEAVRDAVGDVPVLSVLGRVTSVAEAEEALAAGVADLVGATRALMAEPYLVRHALEGHEEDSRTCLHCNICRGRNRGMHGCAINPATGRERRWGAQSFTPAPARRRVVVAGGGPGGLEAARVAALRGHDLTLLERTSTLGGQMRLWASLPGREVFDTTPDWYERQLAKLGVDVRLGFEATAESILALSPEAIVVATGSHYVRTGESGYLALPIPGWDRDFVHTPEEVIENGVRVSGRVLIVDEEGLNTQAGIAELLASGGAEVWLVTRAIEPIANLLTTEEYATVLPTLKRLGVRLETMTHVTEIGDHRVTLSDVFTHEVREVENVEAVVMATCRMPNGRLWHELEGKAPQVFAVGDALAPRSLPEAIHEGQRFARMIGEADAPTRFIEAYTAPIDYSVFARPASTLLDA